MVSNRQHSTTPGSRMRFVASTTVCKLVAACTVLSIGMFSAMANRFVGHAVGPPQVDLSGIDADEAQRRFMMQRASNVEARQQLFAASADALAAANTQPRMVMLSPSATNGRGQVVPGISVNAAAYNAFVTSQQQQAQLDQIMLGQYMGLQMQQRACTLLAALQNMPGITTEPGETCPGVGGDTARQGSWLGRLTTQTTPVMQPMQHVPASAMIGAACNSTRQQLQAQVAQMYNQGTALYNVSQQYAMVRWQLLAAAGSTAPPHGSIHSHGASAASTGTGKTGATQRRKRKAGVPHAPNLDIATSSAVKKGKPAQTDLAKLQNLVMDRCAPLPDYCNSSAQAAAKDVQDGQRFRDNIAQRAPNPHCTCTVCARLLPVISTKANVELVPPHITPVAHIPCLELLRKDMPPSDKYPKDQYPRHGLTVHTVNGVDYCLETAGIKDGMATVCDDCFSSLASERIPKFSLVRIDTGKVPNHLPVLTVYEQILLSPARAMRYLVVMRPSCETYSHPHYRGHVTAFPNPPVAAQLCNTFPISPNSLPEYVNVIFTTPGTSREDIWKKLLKSPMWQVRGWAVLAWAEHLHHVYQKLSKEHPEFAKMQMASTSVLEAYKSLNGVPEPLVHAAEAPVDVTHAGELLEQMAFDARGYASTRTGSSEDPTSQEQLPAGTKVFYYTDSNTWQDAVIVGCATHLPSQYILKVVGDAGSTQFYAPSSRVFTAMPDKPPPIGAPAPAPEDCPTPNTAFKIGSKVYYKDPATGHHQACTVLAVEDNIGDLCYTVRLLGAPCTIELQVEQHDLTPEITSMAGIDEVNTTMDSSPQLDLPATIKACTASISNPEALALAGGVLTSATGTNKCCNDYDPIWPILLHPEAFPWGCGSCPEGISMKVWVQCLMCRNLPAQFSSNTRWQSNMWNVYQRHEVNDQTRITMRMNGQLVGNLGQVTKADLELVFKVLQTQPTGTALKQATTHASPAAKAMLEALRVTCARIPGSPASFAHLRSCATAPWNMYGMYSSFITLNPSPLNARIVFTMAGKEYTILGTFFIL